MLRCKRVVGQWIGHRISTRSRECVRSLVTKRTKNSTSIANVIHNGARVIFGDILADFPAGM